MITGDDRAGETGYIDRGGLDVVQEIWSAPWGEVAPTADNGVARDGRDGVEEHANGERIQTEGGYGRRQVWELVQNGADEMLSHPGRVEVVLTVACLYCANEGDPVSPVGAGAILLAAGLDRRD